MAKQVSKSIKTKSTKAQIRFRGGTGQFQPPPGTPIPENLKPTLPEEPELENQPPGDRPPDEPPIL
jgi:hypothetical protein